MNHERVYKGLFWILVKHLSDHRNLGVNECWGEIYLTKLIKLVIPIFFCNTVKSSNLFQKPKFFMEQKVKGNCVDVFKLLTY